MTGVVWPLHSLHRQSIYQEVLLTALSLLSNFLFELFMDWQLHFIYKHHLLHRHILLQINQTLISVWLTVWCCVCHIPQYLALIQQQWQAIIARLCSSNHQHNQYKTITSHPPPLQPWLQTYNAANRLHLFLILCSLFSYFCTSLLTTATGWKPNCSK